MSQTEAPIIVIGAGPAGLAAATRLSELGLPVTALEASSRVGGMAGSLKLWGHTVDLGPHRFFSSDPVVVDFWHRYVRRDFIMIQRQTRIFYEGKFFDYPLKASNALKNLGPARALSAIASYGRAHMFPTADNGSLEVWVSNRFGRVLFRTFFKTYTEKLWGVSCEDLDADWAAQRIQGLTLWGAIKSALTGNRRNKLKTLVDEFAYPITGNQLFYDRLAEQIENTSGGRILLNARVNRIEVSDRRVTGVVLEDGSIHKAQWVISSMPITLLLKALPDVPSKVQEAGATLRFRNTILVYLLVNRLDLFSDQWLYVHDPNVMHGRITNFRNWSPNTVGNDKNSVVCLEYWCFDDDELWHKSEEELVALATIEVAKVGLMVTGDVVEGKVVRIPRCYPVYDRGYSDHLQLVTDYLDSIEGLTPIGRYGSFKYNNQDHSLLMGIMAAEAIGGGIKPNLWHINTDSTYQESSTSDSLSGAS